MKIIRLISPENVYNIQRLQIIIYLYINEKKKTTIIYLNVLQADNLVCKCVEHKTIRKLTFFYGRNLDWFSEIFSIFWPQDNSTLETDWQSRQQSSLKTNKCSALKLIQMSSLRTPFSEARKCFCIYQDLSSKPILYNTIYPMISQTIRS